MIVESQEIRRNECNINFIEERIDLLLGNENIDNFNVDQDPISRVISLDKNCRANCYNGTTFLTSNDTIAILRDLTESGVVAERRHLEEAQLAGPEHIIEPLRENFQNYHKKDLKCNIAERMVDKLFAFFAILMLEGYVFLMTSSENLVTTLSNKGIIQKTILFGGIATLEYWFLSNKMDDFFEVTCHEVKIRGQNQEEPRDLLLWE